MFVAFDVVSVVRACVRTARTFNNVSGFDSGLPTRQVRDENFLFIAVFASETEIPLAGGKGAQLFFDPRFLIPVTGERNGATKCGCSYKARREFRSRKIRSYQT